MAAVLDARTRLAEAVRSEQRTMRLDSAREILSVAGWAAVSVGSAAVAVSELIRRRR